MKSLLSSFRANTGTGTCFQACTRTKCHKFVRTFTFSPVPHWTQTGKGFNFHILDSWRINCSSAGGSPQQLIIGGIALLTILIIDRDLGFVYWLGHALDKLRYFALPAKSVPDAALLVMQLDVNVDVLVIDPALPGAMDFVLALHRSQKHVRVIGILNDPQQVINLPGVNATHPKPLKIDDSAMAEWIDCIEHVASAAAQTAPR